MAQLYWQICGEGECDLVLLHGWGLNSQVWCCILPQLTPHFRVHLVDLPGYGRSTEFGALSLEEMAETVLRQAPSQAVWLGWSLGGLVATKAAILAPQRIRALINVASSPRFTANEKEGWPGIKPEVLMGFQHQLSQDFQRTVERFLALQTLGTENARQDARVLKDVVLSQPMPAVEVLNGGLEILHTTDLREKLSRLTTPFLRIYGYLDGLVPRKVAEELNKRYPQSPSLVMRKAAHAPFISHPDEFCQALKNFCAVCNHVSV